jgi:uncharacterized lipoprotein YddW (UPF0748 family)
MSRHFQLLLFFLSLSSCGIFNSFEKKPKREFRGVWIATVVNIDWPKNGNDNAEKQKADFLNILNFYQQLNYNAVIVQVRAAGDAFYPSEFAPWSRFLTGLEGKKPDWSEDNLEWMISETHKRGMEFHAWLNPYRATFDEDFEVLSETHDYCTHPEWMVHYGKKNYYNPGLPEVRAHFSKIIAEIVSTYDIDAIHFDDYFYPYKITDVVFDDSLAFKTHALANQSLDDWRRSNIDSLVKETHRTIKSIKPWVQFGISPFGVWKNNATDPRGSDTRAGQTTYEDLYADPLLWMEEGWIDYLAPQVYWSMDLPVASHRKIVNWWAKNNHNTNLYIGNGAYKIRNNSDEAWANKKELPNQFKLAREIPEISGNIVFSAKSLLNNNPDVTKYIKRKLYSEPSLTPITNKTNEPPQTVKLVLQSQDSENVNFTIIDQEKYQYVLWYTSGRNVKSEYPIGKLQGKMLINEKSKIIQIPKSNIKGNYFALSFLDRYGRETKPVVLHLKEIIYDDSKK